MPRAHRLRLLVVACLLLLAAACARSQEAPGPLVVFAASSLTDAFRDLAEAFAAANPGARVVFNFASSTQLTAQLAEGEPADVFASASPAQMDVVVAGGRIAPGAVAVFAANRLTLVVPADNPAGLASLADLARPGIVLVLAAPGVPARVYADEALARLPAATQAAVLANLASEEDNVRQVLAKVALGEADAGIVYATDITPEMIGLVRSLPFPEAASVFPTYPIAPLQDAPQPDLAARFIAFVLSPEGQAVLAARGFDPPPGIGP